MAKNWLYCLRSWEEERQRECVCVCACGENKQVHMYIHIHRNACYHWFLSLCMTLLPACLPFQPVRISIFVHSICGKSETLPFNDTPPLFYIDIKNDNKMFVTILCAFRFFCTKSKSFYVPSSWECVCECLRASWILRYINVFILFEFYEFFSIHLFGCFHIWFIKVY